MKRGLFLPRSSGPEYSTLDDWILHEAIPLSVDSSETFNAAIDKVINSFDDSVEFLGFGEALHGGEDVLILRNRLFQRLVETHEYRAIAIESSFPRARLVNEYICRSRPGRARETGTHRNLSHQMKKRENYTL